MASDSERPQRWDDFDESKTVPVKFEKVEPPPGHPETVFYVGVYGNDEFKITVSGPEAYEKDVVEFTEDLRVRISAVENPYRPVAGKAARSLLQGAEGEAADADEGSEDEFIVVAEGEATAAEEEAEFEEGAEIEIVVTVDPLSEAVDAIAIAACNAVRSPIKHRWVGPEWVWIKVTAGKVGLFGVVGQPVVSLVGGFAGPYDANGECFVKGKRVAKSSYCMSAGWSKV